MTPDQLAYIERRRRQIRYWPFMAVILLVLLIASYVYLYLKQPIFLDPALLVAQLKAQKVSIDQLASLAALGNLAFIGCGLFIFVLILTTSLALWAEHRLIRMLDELQAAATAPRFKDHFSALAENYAHYRPHYPEALFAALAEVSPGHVRAWDCATGNGQAAAGLAPYFSEVMATDASSAQIAAAEAPGNVCFSVAPAEASGLPPASMDLVLVAQAAHWFDLPAFYAEVERVLRPGGVLALLTYSGVYTADDGINKILREFHQVTMAPYWPPERAYVENDYRDLPFPWPEIPFPPQTMTAQWSLDQLIGYLGTWSATAHYRQQRGEDPLPALRAQLLPLWGEQTRELSWALPIRIGRRP